MYPPIVEKFNEIELDYCCGGKSKLEDVLKEKNVDVDKFIEEVNSEFEKFQFDNTQYVKQMIILLQNGHVQALNYYT